MAQAGNQTFQRIEKKYLVTEEQYRRFLEGSMEYIERDQYGLHTICNLYFDTKEDRLIRTSLEKPPYKEKLRLRSYGIPQMQDQVFLELKKKWDGIVYKRRVPMTLEEAEAYIESGAWPGHDEQMRREMDYFMEFYRPMPKVYLAYDREAFFGKQDAELRLTVDRKIRARTTRLHLEAGDRCDFMVEGERYLMEIKVPEAYPVWLARLLSEIQAYPVSFSKYGQFYVMSHGMAGTPSFYGIQEGEGPCLQVS